MYLPTTRIHSQKYLCTYQLQNNSQVSSPVHGLLIEPSFAIPGDGFSGNRYQDHHGQCISSKKNILHHVVLTQKWKIELLFFIFALEVPCVFVCWHSRYCLGIEIRHLQPQIWRATKMKPTSNLAVDIGYIFIDIF